ncbi:hypothetical protein [Vogesella sp. XCS3]|uniref:hypothetical protein n=1 Tax=Vogesella sp. XCS3 TaxID=2877939 RepID=UPI001D0A0DDA|nr:hypothetical protein [Vogesella sp. XCS3]UDM18846.1 hypothetical protein LCH97_18420 [Vogesella sp. XCS3]
MKEDIDALERDLIGFIDDRFMGVEDGLGKLINLSEKHQRRLATGDLNIKRFLPQFVGCVVVVATLVGGVAGAGAWYVQQEKIDSLKSLSAQSQVEKVKAVAFDRIYNMADPRLKKAMEAEFQNTAGQTNGVPQ